MLGRVGCSLGFPLDTIKRSFFNCNSSKFSRNKTFVYPLELLDFYYENWEHSLARSAIVKKKFQLPIVSPQDKHSRSLTNFPSNYVFHFISISFSFFFYRTLSFPYHLKVRYKIVRFNSGIFIGVCGLCYIKKVNLTEKKISAMRFRLQSRK